METLLHKTSKAWIVRITIPVLALLLLNSFISTARVYDPPAPPVQDSTDIDKLLHYYQKTTQDLKNSLHGLSEAQLHFNPGEGKWSIMQCFEHIILSEKMIFGMTKQELEKPIIPGDKDTLTQRDNEIVGSITNRSHKFQAPDMLQPTGQYQSTKDAWKDFLSIRKEITEYIKKANIENLRNHISKHPTGTADGYQNLLFIAAHTERHILQMEEVKTDSNFPKK